MGDGTREKHREKQGRRPAEKVSGVDTRWLCGQHDMHKSGLI